MTSHQLHLPLESDHCETHASWFSDTLERLSVNEDPGWPDAFGDALLKCQYGRSIKEIRVLSLFSGAGGLDIGFHDAGFNIVECNEIEEAFAKTLLENTKTGGRIEGSKVICKDIIDYNPSIENIDFIIGGPPCQSFSAAGARASGVNGTDDDRGNLFLEYARLLEKLQPHGFLFENVYRIVGAQGGKPWKLIQEAFCNLGYALHWRILDAADYGVPQFRERLIIVGLRVGSYKFPYPTHGPDSADNRGYYSAGHAIADIAMSNRTASLGGRHGHLLNEIPPGLNYSYFTDRLGHPKPMFAWRSKFSDYLYKADPDTPVRTIKAQGGQYTGPFHWNSRTFSIDELKRLQTIPDCYRIVGSRQKIIHQIGNSVPPQLSRILALSIMNQVFNCTLPFQMEYMPDSYKLGFRNRKRLLTKIYENKAANAIAKLSGKEYDTIALSKHTEYVRVSDNLQLFTAEDHRQPHFIIEITPHHKTLTLKITESMAESDSAKYRIVIWPHSEHSSSMDLSKIILNSSSSDHNSVLALWKTLESIIKRYYHKDDLVQLFGYYQYKNNYMIEFQLKELPLNKQAFWKVLSNVSCGHCVGVNTHIDELARQFNLTSNNLMVGLTELKHIGYEIRNHNTNRQIKNDMVLIPYAFPSLNERSLQRLTELNHEL